VFQTGSQFSKHFVEVPLAELARRLRAPEFVCFSKLASNMRVTSAFYRHFTPIQPQLQELIELSDVDHYLMRKGD
jgi:hypothetical protein